MKRRNVNIRQQLLVVERKCHKKVQIYGFTFDQDISREKLAHAIILHEYTLSMVDHVGFRDFATSLQPLFKMVSHNTIKGEITKIYNVEKGKMISYLKILESRIAITSDKWTSNQKKGYMVIRTLQWWVLVITTSYCKVSYFSFKLRKCFFIWSFNDITYINDNVFYIYF